MNFNKNFILWPFALFVSLAVFIPSLFFKFTGAVEARHIFTTVGEFLGMGFFEPYGRFLIGFTELVAAIFLLVPRTQIYGALLTVGVLSGAIFFHLFSPLGVIVRWTENGVPQEDSTLFMMAVISFIAGLTIIWFRRKELSRFINAKKSEGQTRISAA